MDAQDDVQFFETNDVTYEITAKAFKKTSRLPHEIQLRDGRTFLWRRSWNHERIDNEARALKLVSEKTDIPVPCLLDWGGYPDGRRYLTTELIDGTTLDDFPSRNCSKPEGQKHTIDDMPCGACSDEAFSNARDFITKTVLPQLSALTSRTRGIDGFVMPPAWLSPDGQPPWIGKKNWKTLPLDQPEYVFQHGDLGAQNIIIDPQTMQVRALIDWEYAGFFPPGMEYWSGTLCQDAYARRGENIAPLIGQFLATEFVDCYDSWSDKEQLHELIKIGALPHPDQLRQRCMKA